MILTGKEIEKQHKLGRLKIDPFSDKKITTNTYDLTLGPTLSSYEDEIIDPAKKMTSRFVTMTEQGYKLDAGDFILGHSQERIGSDFYVPIIHARSSVARLGLFVHVTADLIDLGAYLQVTFQLYATLPIIIYPRMPVAQVSFWRTKGGIKLYDGKYQNSSGPQPSQVYRDFET